MASFDKANGGSQVWNGGRIRNGWSARCKSPEAVSQQDSHPGSMMQFQLSDKELHVKTERRLSFRIWIYKKALNQSLDLHPIFLDFEIFIGT